MDKQEFPFKTALSFRKLIDFWRNAVHTTEGDCPGSDYARRIVKDAEAIPGLNSLIYDNSLIEKHRPLIDSLMTAVFPVAYMNTNLTAISAPLDFKALYSTEWFRELFCDEEGYFSHDLNVSRELFDAGKVITLYAGILKMAYGINMTVVIPLIKTVIDKETGLERYFKMNLDDRFIDIKITGELPPIDREKITLLAENMFNFELWQELIPASLFEFEGFLVVNMFEVTDQEALSRLKFDLLDKKILQSPKGFETLQERVRTMFRNPNLKLGIAALSADQSGSLKAVNPAGDSFIAKKGCENNCHDYDKSIYNKVLESGEPQIIYDLGVFPECTKVETDIVKSGIVNMLVAPLIYEGKTIGVVELGSANPGDVNAINAMKLMEVLPLFSLALKRSLEDRENMIQAIIKEKCTAVHPSVEWRFRKAAINLLENEKTDSFANMEEIVFRDVYPLYALSDIRNSSNIRNSAIQQDLKENLELAKNIVLAASEAKPMPEFQHLIYKIERRMLALSAGLNSGDEAGIVSFLKREIEPLFDNISGFSANVKRSIVLYSSSVDPGLGVLYSKRKEYEQSVKMLNENISN
ncbi:MAG TPA: GAF domain-containing protein, partial [Ignavibacteria bacterium]|nr:GAF domain-containing protein [Ignavibacteria bacterium]